MKTKDIQSGDILAIKGEGFPSPQIIYFMKQYAKKKGIKYDFIGSHLATCFWDKNTGKLLVAESVDNGFHFREFEKHYDLAKGNIKILRPITPYSEKEIENMWNYAMHLQTVNLGYQYWNFIQWILYIELGISTFGKGGTKFTYCYESTARIAESVRPNDWKGLDEVVSFFDVYNNKSLRKVN